DVDVLALTGDVARQHRGQRAQRREHGARLIALVAATAYRWQRVVVVPTAPYRAATREDGEVCRLLGTAGVVAAERGERDPHDAGVCAEERVVVDAERRQPPGSLRLEDDVGGRDEPTERAACGNVVEVDDHSELAGVVVPPEQAPLRPGFVPGERAVPARRVATGGFDDDDLCAEVAEQLPGERRVRRCQFDDAQALEGARGRGGGQITPCARNASSSSGGTPRSSP